MSRPKIGLAFSGGGARALVHVGILKVLLQAGIPIDCIAGTSMGGVIAAAYACGIPIEQIEERALLLAKTRELMKLVDLSPQRKGLLQGSHVRDFLADLFIDRNFENLSIPLALPAVDLVSAREVVFTTGLVFPAVLATIAVPGLFTPMEIGPYRLVDGGVLNNLPVGPARELGADVVIAIDAQFEPESEKPWQDLPGASRFPLPVPDFFLDFYRAELIMVAEITRAHLQTCPPDLLLHPAIPPSITMFLGFPHAREIISIGEHCANEVLPEIRRLAGLA